MVRHGRAAAGWDTSVDPPLDEVGAEQAEVASMGLKPLGPLPIVSSPLLRCRETAAPLAAKWGIEIAIEPRVAEIPSPAGHTMATRVGWLREAMQGTWSALGPVYTDYRDSVHEYIAGIASDTVVFSHFVAINAVLGKVLNDDSVLIDSLDNCSVTVFETRADGSLGVINRGHQADTLIR